jgi:hypothetical protein
MIPNLILANIEELINLGYKNDVIYYSMTPSFTKSILKYVNHKSKFDEDFKSLITTGKMMNKTKYIFLTFKLENENYIKLLENILDEPIFNNIVF